jgi:hypothetical protein
MKFIRTKLRKLVNLSCVIGIYCDELIDKVNEEDVFYAIKIKTKNGETFTIFLTQYEEDRDLYWEELIHKINNKGEIVC